MEVLCKVCGDKASGKHYGVPSCDGCRGFFKRSIRRNLEYVCKERGHCIVDVTRRNQCQACRFSKCIQVKMNRDAVQHERAPRTHSHTSPNSPPYGMSSQLGSTIMLPSNFILPSNHPTLSTHNILGQSCQFVNIPAPSASRYTHWSRLHSFHNSKILIADDQVSSSEEIQASHPIVVKSDTPKSFSLEFEKQIQSPITSVPSTTPIETTDGTYESSAKLLFLAVKWAKSIPSFTQFCEKDQILLLEEAWCDLFVLNAAQCCFKVNEEITSSVSPFQSNFEKYQLDFTIQRLKFVINKFMSFQVDQTEFACLKALALFKPESSRLSDIVHLEYLQDQTLQMLFDYCANKNKSRFGQLLLLLPYVSSLNKFSIQDIFFRKTVGNIPIENVITEMIRHGVLI